MYQHKPNNTLNIRPLSPAPTLNGAAPGLCLLWIKDFENVDPPPGYPFGVGYASGISYTVQVQLPSGFTPEVSGVIPRTPRVPHPYLVQAFDIPDSSSDTVPKFLLPGAILNGTVYLLCSEIDYRKSCSA